MPWQIRTEFTEANVGEKIRGKKKTHSVELSLCAEANRYCVIGCWRQKFEQEIVPIPKDRYAW